MTVFCVSMRDTYFVFKLHEIFTSHDSISLIGDWDDYFCHRLDLQLNLSTCVI